MSKVLLSQHGPFLKVAKLLQAQNLGIEWLCLQPPMAKLLQDIDIPAQPLAAFASPEDQGTAAIMAARTLVKVVMGEFPNDKHVHPAVIRFLKENLGGYLYPRMMDLTLLVQTVDRLHPDLVLLHNDVEPLTRSVAAWARHAKVPCLHVPHAVYLDSPWVTAPGTDVHDIITASHLCVAGPFQKEWYSTRLSEGQTLEIRETGLPQFDPWVHLPTNRALARQLLGLDANRPVVVYASSWRQDTNLLGCHDGIEEAYTAFLNACKLSPGIQPVVKLHPRATNGQAHVDLAQKMNIGCIITGQHLEMCLHAADVLISFGPSNIVLEAAIQGGLHLASIEGFPNDPEVTTLKPQAQEITDYMQRIIGNVAPETHTLVAKYCGVRDGKATERVAAWIKELLQP